MRNMLSVQILVILLVCTILIIFHFFHDCLLVQMLGLVFVLMLLVMLWNTTRAIEINRIAFNWKKGQVFPLAGERVILGFLKNFSESGEDQFIRSISSYANMTTLLALPVQPWWFCVSALLYSIVAFSVMRRIWPGYALVLGGTSRDTTRALVEEVAKLISPLNTVHLLNIVTIEDLQGRSLQNTGHRIRNELVSWKTAVEIHASFARVIILDLTKTTRALEDEIDLINMQNMWFKTIVIGQIKALESTKISQTVNSVNFNHEAFIANTNKEALSILRLLREDLQNCPTREKPVGKLSGVVTIQTEVSGL